MLSTLGDGDKVLHFPASLRASTIHLHYNRNHVSNKFFFFFLCPLFHSFGRFAFFLLVSFFCLVLFVFFLPSSSASLFYSCFRFLFLVLSRTAESFFGFILCFLPRPFSFSSIFLDFLSRFLSSRSSH